MSIYLGAKTTTVEFGRGATRTVASVLTDMDTEAVFANVAIRNEDNTNRTEDEYLPEEYPVHLFFPTVTDIDEHIKTMQELRTSLLEAQEKTTV